MVYEPKFEFDEEGFLIEETDGAGDDPGPEDDSSEIDAPT